MPFSYEEFLDEGVFSYSPPSVYHNKRCVGRGILLFKKVQLLLSVDEFHTFTFEITSSITLRFVILWSVEM